MFVTLFFAQRPLPQMPVAPQNLQVISVVRFAYPGLGMFQEEHDSVAARQAFLWTPERMETRFRSLEHICLRTLAAQTDPDFRTLILTGDALPQPWRDRLRDLATMVPGAEVCFHPAKQQQDALAEVIRPRVDRDGPPVLYFRQDDDDGVNRRFVQRCREIFRDTARLWQRGRRLCIDFNRGFRIHLTPDGPRVQPLVEHHIGVAQGIILDASNQRTGIHFPHHRIATLLPCVTITDVPMWLRGMDGTNDSAVRDRLHLLEAADDDQLALLKDKFALDLAAIQASF